MLCTAGDVGTFTVSYPNIDATTPDKTAHVSYSGGGDGNASFGAFPQDAPISTSSSYPTYAGDGYALVLPNESGDKLILRVDYTLVSEDGSDEVIKVSGATAEIPATYSTWLSGYAYTYIFKINPNTNGTTGAVDANGNPIDTKGLYPITFDAAVIQDVEGIQETITTVSEPSITTYQDGKAVTSEFVPGSEITAMVMKDDALETLTTEKATLFTIPAGKTEADILAALTYREDVLPDGAAAGTILGRNGIQLTPATGLTVSGTSATFTPAAAGTYAFIYKITEGAQTALYEKQSFTPGASVKGYFWDYTYEDQTGKDANVYATYYRQTVATPETYAQPATAPTFFYGQSVAGLYVIDENGTVRQAYGTAHTGTIYYLAPVAVTAEELAALPNADGLYAPSGSRYIPTSGDKDANITYYHAPVAVQTLAYADIQAQITAGNLFTDAGTTAVTAVPTNATEGNTYYLKSGTVYNRVVLLPEHADGYYILSHSSKQACPAGEKAVAGATYYDRYWWYDGAEYAVKVIKVQ